MDDIIDYFKNKKITVMGLGLLGRGLGDTQFMADAGSELIVTDLKSAEALEESAAKLRPYPNVTLRLGEHTKADFEGRDFVLAAAGVPHQSPYLAHARSSGVSLKMSAALLAELSELPVIGVTGTRGKSTVTELIYHTLRKSGRTALLGGNVRGVSNLQLLKELSGVEVLVMELDSWQLQGFGWSEQSPHISVFTNLMPDHLNYYDQMEDYFADKANIYSNQRPGDVLVAGKEVAAEWISSKPAPYGFVVPEAIPEDWKLLIRGSHNAENASLAYEALKAYGLTDTEIRIGFETFRGVEGRLQYLKTVNGVEIYNDNNATTPIATTRALETVVRDKNVVLICGGSDKQVPMGQLPEVIEKTVKKLILYSGTGTEALKKVLPDSIPTVEHASIAECVKAAKKYATSGDAILFSPGFASFGAEYKNEYDRNDQFLALIDELF